MVLAPPTLYKRRKRPIGKRSDCASDPAFLSEAGKISKAVARAPSGERNKARYVKTREFGEPNDRSFFA